MTAELLRNIDALLVTDPVNIRYLTGFVSLSPSEQEAYVLITPATLYLFTHALYLEQARNLAFSVERKALSRQLKNSVSLQIFEISREDPLSKRLIELFAGLFHARTVKSIKLGFEETNLTFAEHQKLKKDLSAVDLVPISNRVEQLRQIKRPDEIAHIKKAAQLTDKCFTYIIKLLKPGITESDLAWEIESFFHKNGAESAFPLIVAFGKNSSQPHYAPKQGSSLQGVTLQGVTLSRQSLVLLDFGARVNGYCADMTRVVFVGKPPADLERAYNVVLKAQKTALMLLKNGERNGAKLDHAARIVIGNAGLPSYPHSLGHNVGLAIHEGPRLYVKKDEELNPGMVFTIEPAIYLEGKYGIRIEDLVLLNEDGVELLTKTSKMLTIP